jgi:hypothetical protein
VISRTNTNNYDINDTPSSTSTPDTLFDPWFAPDESDLDNYAYGQYDYRTRTSPFPNNYLNDEGGSCTGTNALVKATDAVKQGRVCKYKGVTPNTYGGTGPNFLCTTTAITPLTNTRATLNSAVAALAANGNTNILEGLMWGWRTLSPAAPFTEGKAYNAPNNKKVIILMTDGVNNLGGSELSDLNHSNYSSYGYAIKGRVGSSSSSNATLTTALNTRTLLACTNAKAQGIIIYTIGFGADASASAALLTSCASQPSYFYQPQNSSDLQPVFLSIAQSINSLRLAE